MVRKIKFFLILLFFIVINQQTAFSTDDDEFQYWLTAAMSGKINNDLKISLEEEYRFGDDAEDFYYQHSDLGLTYSGLAKWFDLGINYRHIFEESRGKWRVENRPHFNATLKYKAEDWSFSTRSRFEYRNREDKEDFWRYRNKFTLTLPFFDSPFKIKPYLADEIYYDFDVSALNRNRLSGGFTFAILKKIKADIYYLWQAGKSSDNWSNINVLGSKFTLAF